MTEITYYVAAKNLTTRKMSVYDHKLFYVVHDDDTYSRFHPKDVTDFKARTHYGQIIDNYMLFYYIVEMGEDREELENRLRDAKHPNRIRNTNRLSHSVTKRPLKEMSPAEEIIEAKMSKKSAARKKIQAAKHANNDRCLKKFLKKGKIVSSTPTTAMTSKPIVTSDDEGQSDAESVETKEKQDGQSDTEPSKNDPKTQVASSSSGSVEKIANPVLEGLKSELASFLKDQLAQMTTKQGASNSEEMKVTNVQIPLPGNLAVPKGQIHIGDNVLISLDDVHAQVELKTFELRKRIRFLLQLFFPEDYSQRSLDPNKVSKVVAPCLPISKAQVAIMSDLLDKMSWLKGATPDCSAQNVSLLIRKETQRFRAAENLKAKPENERLQIIEDLRARAKELRERASMKRKAEKATEASKKKKVNHEEPESVSEESADSDSA